MKLRARRWTQRHWKVLSLSLPLSACAGAASSGAVSTSGDVEGPGCVVARVPLTIGDGVYPYIEPEDLIEVASGYVVVGSPSYTWAPGAPGDSLPLTMHRHLAARFTLDGRATLIERPVQDSVGSVRSVALGGERWGVLFDIERRPPSGHGWESVALWYAEHDGVEWALLEPVSLPADGALDIDASSELVRVDDRLIWVAPVLPTDGTSAVVEYTRREGRWQQQIIGDDWVETSTLAYTAEAGLWMARSGADAGRTRRSLQLYRRNPEWQLVRTVYVSRGGARAGDLGISFAPDGVAVTWRTLNTTDHGAYALTGIGAQGEATLVDLDRDVLQVIPLRFTGDALRWIVARADVATQTVDLRLLGARPLFGAERLAAAPSPYLGFLAALARTPTEAILVGAEVSSDPADPFVRSLVLRLSASCT